MLTGGSLFAGRDVEQIAHNVHYVEHAPPSRANPDVPQMLDFVVARALKKDPAVRYQDAYEMCADLRDALAEMKGRAPARKGDESERTQTIRLEAGAKEGPLAPSASQIVADTRLPLSRLFDSAAALERLERPTRGDRKRILQPPRPVGLLRRVLRDRLPRRLVAAALVAGCLGVLAVLA
jgi:serine/threonine-protein kinase